jgi:hypothetical protein
MNVGTRYLLRWSSCLLVLCKSGFIKGFLMERMNGLMQAVLCCRLRVCRVGDRWFLCGSGSSGCFSLASISGLHFPRKPAGVINDTADSQLSARLKFQVAC